MIICKDEDIEEFCDFWTYRDISVEMKHAVAPRSVITRHTAAPALSELPLTTSQFWRGPTIYHQPSCVPPILCSLRVLKDFCHELSAAMDLTTTHALYKLCSPSLRYFWRLYLIISDETLSTQQMHSSVIKIRTLKNFCESAEVGKCLNFMRKRRFLSV